MNSSSAPIRAHQRFMVHLLGTEYKEKKILPREEDLERVNDVFKKMGGSWEKLFKGSSSEINLVRQVVTAAIEQGVLKTRPSWE
jgi:hypothetical protein